MSSSLTEQCWRSVVSYIVDSCCKVLILTIFVFRYALTFTVLNSVERPILTPSEPVYSCENETTYFTCSDSQVTVLEWKVKPYTDIDDELSYIPSQLDNIPGQVTRNNTYNTLFSNLESFSSQCDDKSNSYKFRCC